VFLTSYMNVLFLWQSSVVGANLNKYERCCYSELLYCILFTWCISNTCCPYLRGKLVLSTERYPPLSVVCRRLHRIENCSIAIACLYVVSELVDTNALSLCGLILHFRGIVVICNYGSFIYRKRRLMCLSCFTVRLGNVRWCRCHYTNIQLAFR